MGLLQIVEDLGREFSARLMELSGHEEQAECLRKLGTDKEMFSLAWGKSPQVKASVLDVMDFAGKLMLSSYLNDLVSEPLKKFRPRMEEGFMAWALRTRLHEQVEFLLLNMPFSIDEKWKIISAIVEHSGYRLHPTTHCFV